MRRTLLLSIIPAILGGLLSRADAQPGGPTGDKARVIVRLPASAKLFVEDRECPLKSETRAFSTKALEPGKKYEYSLRAEVKQGDKSVGITRTVTLRAGDTIEVQFGDERSMLAAGGLAPAVGGGDPPVTPPVTPPRASGFPSKPAPWLVMGQINRFGDLSWYRPEDGFNARRRTLDGSQFTAQLADGTELTAAELKTKLERSTVIAVSADASAIDSFYLNLLTPSTIVLVPKKPFPDQERANQGIVFALAGPGGERMVRVRWQSAAPSGGAMLEDSDARPGGRVRVARASMTEYTVEIPITELDGYDSGNSSLGSSQISALVKQETPVILLDAGRRPRDLALGSVLKKDTRILVLPVGFRAP